MNRLLTLSLCLLSLCANAMDLYSIHPLSEKEMLQMYTSILKDGSRHGDRFWTNIATNPRVGFWGTGHSDEPGIRSISCMILANGALLKYGNVLNPSEREECKSKTCAALRYELSTHVTGTQKCVDGKKWGNSWQSALWTANFTFGAWLIWDELDPQLQKDVQRVIAFESDRFLKTKPPGGSFNDTKAEENGWNLTCIAIAATMFPNHTNAPAWKQKAIEYMMNTLSAPQDATDHTIVDGRKVSDWFSGANVHSDFTLENHGFFHPSYIACSSYFLTQTAMYFTYAHQPVPEAATHHLMDTWRMYQKFILPDGEAAYPQGMDWELHNLPYINLYAGLASLKKDPLAARMEQQQLQYFRAWQLMTGDGSLTFPGSHFGFSRHACTIDQITWAFVAHKIFGPSTGRARRSARADSLEGVRTYKDVQLITQRTDKKFVSFSWTNHVMGMIIPIDAGHQSNPDFTTPIRTGFIGTFDTGTKNTKPIVLTHDWEKTTNGFETTGTVLLNNGALKQTLHFYSIGKQTVVYTDHVTAAKDIDIREEHGVPIGIENDPITGSTRTAYHQNGSTTFSQSTPQPPATLPGSWANIDARLGVIAVSGNGLNYTQAHGYTHGISVCEDTLYASYSTPKKQLKAGNEAARRIAIFFTEVTPAQTAALAKSVHLEKKDNVEVLHFQLPEGETTELDLK